MNQDPSNLFNGSSFAGHNNHQNNGNGYRSFGQSLISATNSLLNTPQ